MAEDKDKKLGYKPEIQYTEEYDSKYVEQYDSNNISDIVVNNNINETIDNTMDEVASLVSMLPDRIHIAVNQVFKPVYLDWKNNFKDLVYPERIPDPDDLIFVEPSSKPTKPGEDPTGGDKEEKPEDDENDREPGGDPPGHDGPPNPSFTDDEEDEDDDEDPNPSFDWEDIYEDIDDDTTDVTLELDILFPEINITETIELEYTKNMMDLYNYYSNKLVNTLSSYYMQLLMALDGTTTPEQLEFLSQNISLEKAKKATDETRTLMDASLKCEVVGNLKLSFIENMFKVENTLYHLKQTKVAHELRHRYNSLNKDSSGTKEGSTSAKVSEAMIITYGRKYEDAYINYYKYLNSSLSTLEDFFKEILTGLKTKSTINKK